MSLTRNWRDRGSLASSTPASQIFNTLDSSLIAGASNKLRNGNSTPRHRARAMSAELLAGNDRLIQRNCRGCPLALAPTTQPNAH